MGHKKQAYVVGQIRMRDEMNNESPRDATFSIFSETTPTSDTRAVLLVAMTVEDDSYEDASFIAERLMDADARYVRTMWGSRPCWRVATVQEFSGRLKGRNQ